MKCQDVEIKMIFFLEKNLQEQEMQQFTQHIAQCKGCASKLNYLQEAMSMVELEKSIEVRPFLYTRVQARMEPKHQSIRILRLNPVLLAMASVFVVAIFTGVLAGKLTIQKSANYEVYSHNVAYFNNDAALEGAESKLLNN